MHDGVSDIYYCQPAEKSTSPMVKSNMAKPSTGLKSSCLVHVHSPWFIPSIGLICWMRRITKMVNLQIFRYFDNLITYQDLYIPLGKNKNISSFAYGV